jgi:hypothetical protein
MLADLCATVPVGLRPAALHRRPAGSVTRRNAGPQGWRLEPTSRQRRARPSMCGSPERANAVRHDNCGHHCEVDCGAAAPPQADQPGRLKNARDGLGQSQTDNTSGRQPRRNDSCRWARRAISQKKPGHSCTGRQRQVCNAVGLVSSASTAPTARAVSAPRRSPAAATCDIKAGRADIDTAACRAGLRGKTFSTRPLERQWRQPSPPVASGAQSRRVGHRLRRRLLAPGRCRLRRTPTAYGVPPAA